MQVGVDSWWQFHTALTKVVSWHWQRFFGKNICEIAYEIANISTCLLALATLGNAIQNSHFFLYCITQGAQGK